MSAELFAGVRVKRIILRRHVHIRWLLLGGLIGVGASCSGPSTPTPVPRNDPPPAVQNTPPTIGTFRVQGPAANEPPNFADLGERIEVSATVSDPETAINDLTYRWSSAVGTFSGAGRAVTWIAPSTTTSPTPIDVALTLEVVETYQSQGRAVENRVTGSTTLSLHNSAQEVSALAKQFLDDFSDSNLVDVAYVMRNFEPGCYGTAAETADVTKNRQDFTILEWDIGVPATTVNVGGFCSSRSHPGDACSLVPAYWRSQAKRDLYNAAGTLVMRRGQTMTVTGVDRIAAMYYPAQKRWRLCDSAFSGTNSTSLVDLETLGLVP